MRRLLFFLLFLCVGCGEPATPTEPFIKVTLTNPDGFTAPEVDTLEIFSAGLVDGQQLSSTSTADVAGIPLPAAFVILFSERARGVDVDVRVRGFAGGVDVFTATVTAAAGTSEVVAVVRFCGDSEISSDRQEQCDDANQDNTDDCLNSCQSASCGDGFVEVGVEECDDGNTSSDDGCDAQCKREFVTQVAAGGLHTCVLINNGKVRCWGNGANGQLGYGNTENIGDDELPSSAGNVDIGGKVTQITAGAGHTCVLLDSGDVKCWGLGIFGQLGYGSTENIGDDELPSSVGTVNVGGFITQIVAGTSSTCALLSGGALRCWGSGQSGKLGYGNQENIGDDELPNSAGDISIGRDVVQVSAGGNHTCVVLDDGNAKCWGDGNSGALGYGNITDIGDNEPPSSVGTIVVGSEVEKVFAGSSSTCALLVNGSVRCWGDASVGQLGYGNTNDIGKFETPSTAGNVNVGGLAARLAVGRVHSCVILENGSVRCWGSGNNGNNGALGYGNLNNVGDDETPASVGSVDVGDLVGAISAGNNHTCVLLFDGGVKCWGNGVDGRLGYGNPETIGDDETPISVGLVPIF
jgi:cysteine-rich repeat protein